MSLAPPATPTSPGQQHPQGSLLSFPQSCQDPGAHRLQAWVTRDTPQQPDVNDQLCVKGTKARVRGVDLFQSW